jgi:tripartite-type tricarboxylate transporter receptor subunit TctC
MGETMSVFRIAKLAASALACMGAMTVNGINAVSAQPVTEFYKGKTITLTVGSGVGGGDDIFARIFAPYLTKYLPGHPEIIVQNLPGAGGVLAAARMANTLPRDGTAIGTVIRGVPTAPLVSEIPLSYDSRKLNWLGSLAKESSVALVWHTSPVRTFDDLFKIETTMGTVGGNSDTNVYAQLFNQTLGTKIKIVSGYPSGPDIDFAIERGEVDGRAASTWTYIKGTRSDWLKENKIRILTQMGLERDPELPDVPNVLEYVKDPKIRSAYEFLFSREEVARPYVAPPNVPADRLAALRKAFADATADPGFSEQILKKADGTVHLVTGEQMQTMMVKYYGLPADVLGIVQNALKSR